MRLIILSAVFLLLSPAYSHAQVRLRTIDVPATAGWKHAGSGVILMRTIGGLSRQSISDTGAKELDVIVRFRGDDGATEATVYLFRPAVPDSALWFDRSRTIIEQGDRWGLKAQVRPDSRLLSPLPVYAETGLRITYPLVANSFRSTALAVAPVGDWLVKVRISSTELEHNALDATLSSLLNDIRWPADNAAPSLKLMAACSTSLRFVKARKVKPDRATTLLDSLMGSIVPSAPDDKAGTKDNSPVTYCRDAASTIDYGVYRADGSNDSYLMALSDAGITVAVDPAIDLKRSRNRYSIKLHDREDDLIYPSFDALPSPTTVREMLDRDRPLSAVSRGDGGSTISLPSK